MRTAREPPDETRSDGEPVVAKESAKWRSGRESDLWTSTLASLRGGNAANALR